MEIKIYLEEMNVFDVFINNFKKNDVGNIREMKSRFPNRIIIRYH